MNQITALKISNLLAVNLTVHLSLAIQSTPKATDQLTGCSQDVCNEESTTYLCLKKKTNI